MLATLTKFSKGDTVETAQDELLALMMNEIADDSRMSMLLNLLDNFSVHTETS